MFPSLETLLARQQYPAAETLLAQRQVSAPQDDEALYLHMVVEQTEMLDYESYQIEGLRFLAIADTISHELESRLDSLRGDDSLRGVFYVGAVYGEISTVEAKTGSMFSAFTNAMSALSRFKAVLRRDSAMPGALLGAGLFHYYAGNRFSWVPFIEGDEELGQREIEKATLAPFPYGFAAMNSLCWILMDRKQYGRADSLAVAALGHAPGNTIFLRIRALAQLRNGRCDSAIALGEKLRRSPERARRSTGRTLCWRITLCAAGTIRSEEKRKRWKRGVYRTRFDSERVF